MSGWGVPGEEQRRVGVTAPVERGMTPEDVAFWDIVLDNFSGAFVERMHDIVEGTLEQRAENEAERAMFEEPNAV